MTFRVLGITDEVTVCDCCGKKNLKCTVELENRETGDVVRYGRDCAGAAVLGGGKARTKAERVEAQARAVQKIKPLIEAVTAALPSGIAAAVKAGRDLIEERKAARRPFWINGCQVGVVGFRSWGAIQIDYNGGLFQIPVTDEIPD